MNYAIPSLTEHTMGYKNRFWVESAHHVDCWHLILVEEGCFSYSMLEKQELAERYSAVLFPINVEFSRKVIDDMVIHHFTLLFDKQEDWMNENGQFLYGKLPVTSAAVKEVCEFCAKHHGNEYLPLKDGVIKGLWCMALAAHLQSSATAERIIIDDAVRAAVKYMHAHMREKISVDALAKSYGFTHVRFTRLFTKETGKPPVVYLNEIRLDKAKRLLRETNFSIAEIAEECGFENQFYLHNRFKKSFGMSPTVYKKLVRNEGGDND